VARAKDQDHLRIQETPNPGRHRERAAAPRNGMDRRDPSKEVEAEAATKRAK
jgi:hypothetical protein